MFRTDDAPPDIETAAPKSIEELTDAAGLITLRHIPDGAEIVVTPAQWEEGRGSYDSQGWVLDADPTAPTTLTPGGPGYTHAPPPGGLSSIVNAQEATGAPTSPREASSPDTAPLTRDRAPRADESGNHDKNAKGQKTNDDKKT